MCVREYDPVEGHERTQKSGSSVTRSGRALTLLSGRIFTCAVVFLGTIGCTSPRERNVPQSGGTGVAPRDVGTDRVTSAIEEACRFFNQHDYEHARITLENIPPDQCGSLRPFVERLNLSVEFRLQLEQQLPLHPIIREQGVVIENMSDIPVNKGVLERIDLVGGRLYLRNLTNDKVKPDVGVLILNADGVIILQHWETWLLLTLKPNESYVAHFPREIRFPESLVFSKWGALGWNIVPKYALCVGSRAEFDRLKGLMSRELMQIPYMPKILVEYPYDLKKSLPEVIACRSNEAMRISNSQIVDSVLLSQSQVHILYRNRSEMRIKPDIQGYVFNKDGTIIASFQDSWVFASLAPNERKDNAKAVSLSIPEELVFSRWARTTYDVTPAWFLFAGSSTQLHDLSAKVESTIREMNTASLSRGN
jgi:hypothetical protein